MNIRVGTKVEGNWGAMVPLGHGHVASVLNDVAMIAWEEFDDNGQRVGSYYEQKLVSEIHEQGWRSANGSPIGIFVTEE